MTPSAPSARAAAPAARPLDTVPHHERAHAAARAVLGCDHLADDAVQEGLLALWALDAEPPDLRGWFVRTVVHRARHLRRTLRRRQRHEQDAAHHHCEHHPDCDNPLHHACAHELTARCATAIAQLPEPQRVVFVLHERTGLDYRGLAAQLRLPVGTVRSRLHRARQALTKALAPALPSAC